ncbi:MULTISPECIES: adenylate/guanylate cyclase domain-containing protein [Methylobacterium]|uniref:adenylate/guanylate cyclase domain-containing protein n=1 Tax=Methylobacterium TaxID=407 RepID=UPI0013EAED67|nr:adenylate/guanylate cyclase domain-containing protein [Methylobacterium sp. DB0501]NGM34256.1 adenylate/guanylate cyclase domain-containing protein [Methylobacterium sp. DB0501]
MAPFRARLWLVAPTIGALAGLLYGAVFGVEPLVGAIRGVFIGTPLMLYERDLILARWRALTRRAATPVFALATLATYVAIIVLGNAVAGTILHRGFGYMPDARTAMTMSEAAFAYTLAIAALATFVFRVRDLMGPRVFASLLVGRYHRPITEERIFLFLDVAGSTRFAEEHGDLAAQTWLGAIFAALALPVRRARGSIDDYVGDMALVSWSIDRGTRDAACLRCVFDFIRTVESEPDVWIARFGALPRFRAALHCGPVVTAEIGLERRKIAYFGDALNTTSRLEGLAKELDVPVIVSGDLLDRLDPLPGDLHAADLGCRPVRGRKEPLRIAAIRESASPAPSGASRQAG